MTVDCEFLCGSIPRVQIGRPGSPVVVMSGGQSFMRRASPERLLKDALRLKRIMPCGLGFTVFGYGPRHYAEAGMDGLADSFAGILSCQPQPVRLVGISFGGMVAVRLAARHPDLVSDLILVSSAASFSEEGRTFVKRQIQLADQRRFSELLSEFGGMSRRPWYNLILRTRLLLRQEKLASEMNSPEEISAYLGAALATERADVYESLHGITARTLVIGGTKDQVFGQNIVATANAIRHSRLYLLPDETHMAPIERAAQFRRQISDFLSEEKSHTRTNTGRESVSAREGNANADV